LAQTVQFEIDVVESNDDFDIERNSSSESSEVANSD
jgi:hypothetical protein